MKPTVVSSIAAFAIVLAATATAGASEELAKSKGCMACHSVAAKRVGPAYKDVAARYKGNAEAESMLVEKISQAKGHPKVAAQSDEVLTLVRWVLSL
jgi:cytochrome c